MAALGGIARVAEVFVISRVIDERCCSLRPAKPLRECKRAMDVIARAIHEGPNAEGGRPLRCHFGVVLVIAAGIVQHAHPHGGKPLRKSQGSVPVALRPQIEEHANPGEPRALAPEPRKRDRPVILVGRQ